MYKILKYMKYRPQTARPAGRAYSAPQDSLAGIKGTSKAKRRVQGVEGEEREGQGCKEGKEKRNRDRVQKGKVGQGLSLIHI